MTLMSVSEYDECAEMIARRLGGVLKTICDTNDGHSSCRSFIGASIPAMDLDDYCNRLLKYFRCSPVVFVCAAVYIDRFVNSSNTTIHYLNVHRLLVIALSIAVKVHEDSHYSNAYYSQVGGLDVNEFNNLEAEMLEAIEFFLFIDPEDLEQYSRLLTDERVINEA
jgi:hypothetical protein